MNKIYRNHLIVGSIPQLDVMTPEFFPMDGLIAYYPFDSNVNDIIGTRHGNPSGITFTPGKKNNGATITADTGYITIPAVAGTNLTVSLWHKYTGTGGGSWSTLLCRDSGTYHHLIIQDSDRKIGFYNGAWFPSSFTMTIGQTYHILITKSGNNQKIYIDNVLVMDSNSSFDNNSYNLSIIGNYSSASPSQGAIGVTDEMAIYNRVVTEEERNLIYNNGAGSFYTPPPTSTNLSAGKTTTYNSAVTAVPSGNTALMLTDGVKTTSPYVDSAAGVKTATIDLGAVYTLTSMKVWHYFSDTRSYLNNKFEYSVDGVNWTTAFNSDVDGTYVETAAGKEVTLANVSARYIRNTINGSTMNTGNHWTEIEAWGY